MMRSSWLVLMLVFLGCNTYEEQLPILSYTINDNGEKEFYKISYEADRFTNQLGESFTTKSIDNKVVLGNFFFTRCPSICPPMRTELIDLSIELSEYSDLLILSHTIDPKHDSTEVLRAYSENTKIPNERWQFVRATETNTKAIAKLYMTNFSPNEDGTDFYHSSYVALIDQQQQIRGFYNVLIQDELNRLKEDISILLNRIKTNS